LNGNRHDKDDSISGISIIKSSINYIIQKIFDPKVVGIVAIAIPVAIAALIVYRKRLSNSLLKEDDDVVSKMLVVAELFPGQKIANHVTLTAVTRANDNHSEGRLW
jgi:hypothetical protein